MSEKVKETKEIELLSKEQRESLVDKIEVLNDTKELLLLPNTEIATTSQVATFYGVPIDAIESVVKRNLEELKVNGMRKMKGKEIKELVSVTGAEAEIESGQGHFKVLFENGFTKIGYSSNIVFSKRAILNIGMLLTKSQKAEEIRKQLLNIEQKAPIEIKVASINDEQQLLLAIMQSTNPVEQAVAISEYRNFTNRHISQLEATIKDKTEQVEEKSEVIHSLTKDINLVNKRQILNKVIRKGGMTSATSRWNFLYKKYNELNHCNIETRMKSYVDETGKSKMSKLDYITDVMQDFNGLYNLAMKLFANDAKVILNEMTELFK